MRIRSMLSFATGAALGAGWMYLNDPEVGADRRVQARRNAFAQGRDGAKSAAATMARAAQTYVVAAVEGYRESREPSGSATDTP